MTDESIHVEIARLQERAKALSESISLARMEMDRRLGEMNNFREENRKDNAKFLTMTEYNDKHEILRTRIETLEKKDSNMDGRFWMLGTGIGILVIVVNILFKYMAK